jgi:hypothetical protein
VKFELTIKTVAPNGNEYCAGLAFVDDDVSSDRKILNKRIGGLLDYVERFVEGKAWEADNEVLDATKPA